MDKRNNQPAFLLGTIKFYLVEKGFGFITPDESNPQDQTQDRFFHHSQLNVIKISNARYKSISQGARVSFTPVENEKGLAAMNVTPI